jgi:hypothetical protein
MRAGGAQLVTPVFLLTFCSRMLIIIFEIIKVDLIICIENHFMIIRIFDLLKDNIPMTLIGNILTVIGSIAVFKLINTLAPRTKPTKKGETNVYKLPKKNTA